MITKPLPNKNRHFHLLKGYNGTIPVFYEKEVHVNRMLGNGSFCAAWTIHKVHLLNQEDAKAQALPNQDNRWALSQQINAARSSSSNSRVKPLLCVVKKPRNDFFANCDNGDRSLRDLIKECKILLYMDHPNIVELHGIGISSSYEPEEDDSDHAKQDAGFTYRPTFLILSRIKYTIRELMDQWNEQRTAGLVQALALDQDNTRQLWKERMSVIAQTANGLAYIHSRRIIIRDLKPANVGVDYRNVVKIFDFGLATVIEKEKFGLDKRYNLSKKTGTARYTAPENSQGQKYGFSADVFSLAIYMHRILSLKTPFTNIVTGEFRQKVYEKGSRPSLEMGWPLGLRELMQRMWAAEPAERPTAAEVAKVLDEMLQGNEEELYPTALFSKSRWFPATKQQSSGSDLESPSESPQEASRESVEITRPALFSKLRLFQQQQQPTEENSDLSNQQEANVEQN